MASCDGRVVVVTGAGTGIGRAEALAFAAEGARVVVNDVDRDSAEAVADEVRALGNEALANGDDISDWDGAGALVQSAIDAFGGLDTLVNNAGILRDRMFVTMTVDDWDAVIKVHLRGTFCPTKHAVTWWRAEHKAGRPRVARIVNTSSPSGIFGNVGQANYGAAKAGLAAFTQILGEELWRYGVATNAIAPSALTRMTKGLPGFKETLDALGEGTDWMEPGDPRHLAALMVWLGSPLCTANGRIFYVRAGTINVVEGWHPGPAFTKQGGFTVDELDRELPLLLARAAPQVNAYGEPKAYGP